MDSLVSIPLLIDMPAPRKVAYISYPLTPAASTEVGHLIGKTVRESGGPNYAIGYQTEY